MCKDLLSRMHPALTNSTVILNLAPRIGTQPQQVRQSHKHYFYTLRNHYCYPHKLLLGKFANFSLSNFPLYFPAMWYGIEYALFQR